ncbi:YaiI/YqxD family protein [Salinisphaera sp. T31B1]|uniref:YaiI/YqxD family protein n=1 Tax=Salinisphaera sp. T31B1 TaxID=727963 RepID=UPI00333EFF34
MHIWVDADACPVVIKQILFKASRRTGVAVTLVANQPINVPRAPQIDAVQVASGFDVADDEIVKRLSAGDLVITADIALAAEALDRQARALSPRGELYTADTIKARLGMRDFVETLRASGLHSGGPDAMNHTDRQRFANQLDRLLTRQLKS